MALNVNLSNVAASAEANAFAPLANSGILRIYDGTQPATADTAVSTQVILAELTMNATAFGAAANGVITANAITGDTSANASGTASWFRLFQSNGTTALVDGTVGTSGCDMNLNSVGITAGSAVNITAFSLTVVK